MCADECSVTTCREAARSIDATKTEATAERDDHVGSMYVPHRNTGLDKFREDAERMWLSTHDAKPHDPLCNGPCMYKCRRCLCRVFLALPTLVANEEDECVSTMELSLPKHLSLQS